ncbi:MAG: succinate dehydrogenase, hydrophobic membrane anchor protein [bacterium]
MSASKSGTGLARLRGWVSGDGTGHFILQRVTAIGLLPLVVWLAFSLAMLPQVDDQVVLSWVGERVNALLLCVFLGIGFYHAQLGVQVVLEDYVSTMGLRHKLIQVARGMALLGAVGGIFLVLTLYLAANSGGSL